MRANRVLLARRRNAQLPHHLKSRCLQRRAPFNNFTPRKEIPLRVRRRLPGLFEAALARGLRPASPLNLLD